MFLFKEHTVFFFYGMDCDPSEARYKWSISMYNDALWGICFHSFILTADLSYSLVSELTDLLLALIFTQNINILLYFCASSWVRSCEKGESWELIEMVLQASIFAYLNSSLMYKHCTSCFKHYIKNVSALLIAFVAQCWLAKKINLSHPSIIDLNISQNVQLYMFIKVLYWVL